MDNDPRLVPRHAPAGQRRLSVSRRSDRRRLGLNDLDLDPAVAELRSRAIVITGGVVVYGGAINLGFVRHRARSGREVRADLRRIRARRALRRARCLKSRGSNQIRGSVAGMLETLAAVEQLGVETIVPGHGPVCSPEVFAHLRRYLQVIQAGAAAGVAAGISPLAAALETDLGEFAVLLDPSKSSATCIAPSPRNAAERGERRWTLSSLSRTWSLTTAERR